MRVRRRVAAAAASMAWALAAALPAAAQTSPPAAAQADTPLAPAAEPPPPLRCPLPPPRPSEAALDAWLAQLPQCQDDLEWLLVLGQRLNAARRYNDAADLIERALLLEPALKGARVDYAVALAGSGDLLAARALLADLLAEPDLPGGLRMVLLRQRSALPLAVTGGWRLDGSAGLRLGRDSNLLGAPDLSSLTLTLGGQLVEVLLDDSYRARAGSYRQLDAGLGLVHVRQGGARWLTSVAARERTSPGLPAADTRQAEVLTEFALPLAGVADGLAGHLIGQGLRGYAGLAAAELRSPLSAYATRSALVGLEAAAGADCDLRLGAERQARRYRNNELLSGNYNGLTFSAVCGGGRWAVEPGAYGLVSLRTGNDHADDPLRPGGRQRQRALRVAISVPLPSAGVGVDGGVWPRSHLLLDAEWSRQQDLLTYSPILDGGRPRVLRRQAVRLEWRMPLTSPWFGRLEPALGLEALSQTSNIALFSLRSRGPYAALRARW
jgi:hypothetical protein